MSFKAGDVIFRCDPWVYCLTSDQIDTRCHRCFRHLPADLNSFRCATCQYAKYCTENCQMVDFRGRHGDECSALKNIYASGFCDMIPADIILALRIFFRLKEKTVESCAVTGRTFASLISHTDAILADEIRMKEVKFYHAILINDILTDSIDTTFSLDLFTQIMGKLQCNAFAIVDDSFTNVGEGVYLGPSRIDHSCDRNATYYFDGPAICIKAIKTVKSLDEVRISYVDCFVPHQVRQNALAARYYFRCTCRLCSDFVTAELYAFRCGTSGCTRAVPADDRTVEEACIGCGALNTDYSATCRRLAAVALLADHESVHEQLCNVDNSDDCNYAKLCQMEMEEEVLFHPGNILYGMTCERLGRLLSEKSARNSLQMALYYMQKYLVSLRAFYSECDVVIGMACLTTGETAVKLGQFYEAASYLTVAGKIFSTVDSESRPLFGLASSLLKTCVDKLTAQLFIIL